MRYYQVAEEVADVGVEVEEEGAVEVRVEAEAVGKVAEETRLATGLTRIRTRHIGRTMTENVGTTRRWLEGGLLGDAQTVASSAMVMSTSAEYMCAKSNHSRHVVLPTRPSK
jgi:hypothetical protein